MVACSIAILTLPCCAVVCVAEKRALYEFIVRHFLASCSKDAVGQETNVTIDIGGEAFRTTGGQCWAVDVCRQGLSASPDHPASSKRLRSCTPL